MRSGFAIAAVLLLLAPPTLADYDAAVQARARGDNATALSEARKGAQAGEPRAQRLLGQMLLKDSSPRADPRGGVTWLKAAADQGDALARRELGNAYLVGAGVPRNPKEALTWLRKASQSGDTISQCSIRHGRSALRSAGLLTSDDVRTCRPTVAIACTTSATAASPMAWTPAWMPSSRHCRKCSTRSSVET